MRTPRRCSRPYKPRLTTTPQQVFRGRPPRGELVVRGISSGAARSSTCHGRTAGCAAAGTASGGWLFSGTGTLHSWTVADHQVHPAYPVPYTIVLVDLDDAPGVRLLGHLPGSPDLHVDMPMLVRFEVRPDGTALPNWEPAPAGPTD